MKRTVIECDRCRELITPNDVTAARAYVASHAVEHVGTAEEPADLCGRCVEALKRFMADPSIADA